MILAATVNNTVFVISFGLYTLGIVAVGLYSAKFAKRSDEDYFLAGRSLGPWVAALSASASSESGWVTLGLVGWAFTSGVSAYWIIPGCLLGFMFNWFFVADRLNEPYAMLSMAAWFCCWIVPFWVLLGQKPKKTPAILGTVSAIVLIGFWLERNSLIWPSLARASREW